MVVVLMLGDTLRAALACLRLRSAGMGDEQYVHDIRSDVLETANREIVIVALALHAIDEITSICKEMFVF